MTFQQSDKEMKDEFSSTKGNSPTYSRIRREWLTHKTATRVPGSEASSTSKSAMMQRWFQEPMREQPYNNIAAVVAAQYIGRNGLGTQGHTGSTDGQTIGGSNVSGNAK